MKEGIFMSAKEPSSSWTPPPRPEWLARFLEETRAWDAA